VLIAAPHRSGVKGKSSSMTRAPSPARWARAPQIAELTSLATSSTIHNLMRTNIFLVALWIAVSVPVISVRATADRTGDEQQIRKIEQDWVDAIVKRDGAFLTKLEADDFTFTDPDGGVVDKAGDIKNTTTGDTVFDEIKIDSLKVRFYGDTGIVNGLGTIKAHTNDEDLGGQYSWTDVFVKRKDQWKAVAAHVTMVEKPPTP
jgi:ketosteroid isomerase-like protein